MVIVRFVDGKPSWNPVVTSKLPCVAQVRLLLEESLLPAMTMVPCNVALVNEVWGVLNLHDYTDRWSIYSNFKVGKTLLRYATTCLQMCLYHGHKCVDLCMAAVPETGI